MDIAISTTNDDASEITFTMGINPQILSGLNKLTQIVLITLLTTSGTDKFDPNSGGNLLRLLGTPVDPTNLSDITSAVTVIINDTQTQILSEQEDINLPSNERLNRIDLLGVNLSADLELEVDIAIVNDDGDRAFRRL